MQRLKRLKDWGWLLLVLLGAALALVLFRGRRVVDVSGEMEAIARGAATRDKVLREGAAAALAEVERDYAETLETLNDDQRKKADCLRRDPVALSRYLVRVARKGG